MVFTRALLRGPHYSLSLLMVHRNLVNRFFFSFILIAPSLSTLISSNYNLDIIHCRDWADSNHMCLNENKTLLLSVNDKTSDCQVELLAKAFILQLMLKISKFLSRLTNWMYTGCIIYPINFRLVTSSFSNQSGVFFYLGPEDKVNLYKTLLLPCFTLLVRCMVS